MGYSHYWRTTEPMDPKQFAGFLGDAQKILDASESLGIALGDGCGDGRPEVGSDALVFNGANIQPIGAWTTDEPVSIPLPAPSAGLVDFDPDPIAGKVTGSWFAGTLVSQRVAPIENGHGSGSYETVAIERQTEAGINFNCTKTAFRPYDLPTTAVLIALKHHFPSTLITSDGDSKDWLDGMMLCFNTVGYGMDFRLNTHKDVEQAEKLHAPKPEPEPVRVEMSRNEETKAVKNALLKEGIIARVGHGRGTAWGWLHINISHKDTAPHTCGPDNGFRSYDCLPCQLARETANLALLVAQQVTGRHGQYDGCINCS